MRSDSQLWELVHAIISGDSPGVARTLADSPGLAGACFLAGATRQAVRPFFLEEIARYVYAGDTALHIAAAAYQTDTVRRLVAAGADVHARNRHGDEPLHYAAVGSPGSGWWNPPAQAGTLAALIEAGADPNAANKTGITPLHRAVRTRCAVAARTLLELGADPERPNKSGSTPMALALQNTGRSGSGSPEANLEQQEIIRLLRERASGSRR